MNTPFQHTTLENFIISVRHRLQEFSQDKCTNKEIMKITNERLCELVQLSGSLSEPEYRSSIAFSTIASEGGMVPASGSNNHTYTNTTKTVYIPSGLWATLFSTNITDATKIPVGSRVIFYLAAGGNNVWTSTVASITNTTSFVLADAYGSALTDVDFSVAVLVINPSSTDDVNVSSYTDYDLIDKITKIEDTISYCEEKPQKDFYNIKKQGANASESGIIIWYREGIYLHFLKGSDITAYGTRTAYFLRLPIKCTAESDYLDIKYSLLGLLKSGVILDVLQALNAPIPDALMADKAKLNALRETNKEKIDKLENNIGTQG